MDTKKMYTSCMEVLKDPLSRIFPQAPDIVKRDPRSPERMIEDSFAAEVGDEFDRSLYKKQLADLEEQNSGFDEKIGKEITQTYGEDKANRVLSYLNMGMHDRHGRRMRNEITLDSSITDDCALAMEDAGKPDKDKYPSISDWSDMGDYNGGNFNRNNKWFRAGKWMIPVFGATIAGLGAAALANAEQTDGFLAVGWDANTDSPDGYFLYYIPEGEMVAEPGVNDPWQCQGGDFKNWYRNEIPHPVSQYNITGLDVGKLYNVTITAFRDSDESDPAVNVVRGVAIMPGNMDRTSPGSENRVDGYDYAKFMAAYRNFAYYGEYDAYADFNGDGRIDGEDYNMFRANYGKSQENEMGLQFVLNDRYTADFCEI